MAKRRQSAAQRRRQRPRYLSSDSSDDEDDEVEAESEEENDAVRLLPLSRACEHIAFVACIASKTIAPVGVDQAWSSVIKWCVSSSSVVRPAAAA